MSAQSPAPSDEPQAGNTGEIAYRFCQECSNLLYPREDRQLNKLLYICKACQSIQEHDSACTYRQNLSEAAQESMGEKAYVSNDPTVGASAAVGYPCFCTMCGECLRCAACGEPADEESDTSDLDMADASPL